MITREEATDDAALTPRLNDLLTRLQMQVPAPPTVPEMLTGFGL